MPLGDALLLVAKESKRFFTEQSAGSFQRATELVDDLLAHKHLASYSVPSSICHLLFLFSVGKHSYSDKLGLLIDYLAIRKEQLQGSSSQQDSCLISGQGHPLYERAPSPDASIWPPLLSGYSSASVHQASCRTQAGS